MNKKNWRRAFAVVTCFDNYNDYLVLFLLNGTEMMLELVASRLMSPFFGNTNFVWTAIIGIILLAGSLGNLIGGYLASLKYSRVWAAICLLSASIYVAMIPLINAPILYSISNSGMDIQIASVIGSLVFFLIPSILLGIITPVIMKERISGSKDKGKESGKITALIAIGSLAGTFLGGFWLIPFLGTKAILLLLAQLMILSVIITRTWKKTDNSCLKLVFFGVFLLAILLNLISFLVMRNWHGNEAVSIDTEYGRIIVEDAIYDDRAVRFYKQSGAYSSATFLDDDKKYDLVFDYLKKYDEMYNYLDANDVLMIGGAAYQYPKYFISHFNNKRMDVVEIDDKATDIAKKYFFLGDLLREYGDERLGLYNEDGRVFLKQNEKKYDAILNDAFAGEVPVGTLATVEAATLIKNHLNNGGVYMSNVLGALSGEKSKFLKAEIKTLKNVFDNVYLLPTFDNYSIDEVSNWIILATNNRHPGKTLEIDLTDAPILTDDYCPVDWVK